jgi:hypothetical protein
VLIVIAGVGGAAIEDRWAARLIRADGDEFASILHEKIPFLAAIAGLVIWLFILWLMIEKPALCVNMRWGQLRDIIIEGVKDLTNGIQLPGARYRSSCKNNA